MQVYERSQVRAKACSGPRAYVAPEEAARHREEPRSEHGREEASAQAREQRAAAAWEPQELQVQGALLEEQHGRPKRGDMQHVITYRNTTGIEALDGAIIKINQIRHICHIYNHIWLHNSYLISYSYLL